MISNTLISLFWVFVVAVLLNYFWELAQAPLYVGLESYTAGVLWHCFIASLGDGVMVLLIAAVGWLALKRWDWFFRPRFTGYLLMLVTSFLMAVLVEWVAVHILARWEYTDKMPTVPGISIGVSPIAQMIILPPVIFRVVSHWVLKRR